MYFLKGQVVRAHLNEFFASKYGEEGAMEADINYIDRKRKRIRAYFGEIGKEFWISFGSVVSIDETKTLAKAVNDKRNQ